MNKSEINQQAEFIANGIMIGVQANKYHTNIYNKKSVDFNHGHLVGAAQEGIKVGVEWQKNQDENRRKANIALANNPDATEEDIEFETAFNDIWGDMESNLESVQKLSLEDRVKLKNAAHDWFESGKLWKESQLERTIDLIQCAWYCEGYDDCKNGQEPQIKLENLKYVRKDTTYQGDIK